MPDESPRTMALQMLASKAPEPEAEQPEAEPEQADEPKFDMDMLKEARTRLSRRDLPAWQR